MRNEHNHSESAPHYNREVKEEFKAVESESEKPAESESETTA